MQKGFVYILTNPSYKDNIIKIGYTTNLKNRLSQLDRTGVPIPFEPYMTIATKKYKQLEKTIHHELDKLTDYRTRNNRDFASSFNTILEHFSGFFFVFESPY